MTLQPIKECDGASLKSLSQHKALCNIGLDCHMCCCKSVKGQQYAVFFDEDIIMPSFKIKDIYFSSKLYSAILKKIQEKGINFLYIRYSVNSSPVFNSFLSSCKGQGCVVFLEIPTYPYDFEVKFNISRSYLFLLLISNIEKKYRARLNNYVDRIVTFSRDKSIYGIKTVNISNAPYKIPELHNPLELSNEFNIITVATIAFWHGIDRLLKGLREFESQNKKIKITLYIVGGGDIVTINQLKDITLKEKLNNVIFTGPLFGDDLDLLFQKCHLAIGCLGCHRKNLDEVKSLKNVEYAMRGIPFVYSENNTDFDNQKYVFKVPANDSPIDFQQLYNFVHSLTLQPIEIKNSVAHLTWEKQFGVVYEEYKNLC